MGFGSYDESEQENQDYDTDLEESEGVSTGQSDHQGAVEYALGTGVSVSSSLLYAEYDSGAGTQTDGIQWINGLALSF